MKECISACLCRFSLVDDDEVPDRDVRPNRQVRQAGLPPREGELMLTILSLAPGQAYGVVLPLDGGLACPGAGALFGADFG